MIRQTKIALTMLAGVLTSTPLLATELTNVEFNTLPGEQLEAVLTFDTAAPTASGYLMESPARIIVDLPDTDNGVDQRRFNLSGDVATSAMLLSTDEKTRLVLNLSGAGQYEMLTRGNKVSVIIDKPMLTESSQGMTQQFADASTATKQLDGFDFRRGDRGEGNVILDLGSASANVDVDTRGSDIVVTIPNYTVPARLLNRMDVVDFATPVSLVSFEQRGRDAVVTINTSDDFDMSAYQANEEFVLSVAPLTREQRAEREAEFAYQGETLSFNFQNIEIRSLLQIIADITQLNLVASDSVQGDITLRLVNVPWDQALDLVLKTKGLDKRLIGNVLMVAPAAEIAERERVELQNTIDLEQLAPLFTEHFEVNYADAADINALFQQMNEEAESGLLSGRGSVIVDERTNSIIMSDTQAKLMEFRELLHKLDIPVRQVSIEARIVLASTGFSRDLGVRWGFDYVNSGSGGDQSIGSGTVDGVVDIVNGDPISYGDAPGGLVVDLAAAPANGNATSFAIGLLSGSNNFLTLELSALEAEGRGEVISQPKVIAGNQQTAVIKSGSEIPYQQATSSGATAVSFKDATLKLEVTPQITPDNRIIMQLVINKDAIGEIVAGVPTIDVTQLQTQVIADNGQTIVLGGIFEQAVVESEAKTPFLGDLPLIGHLFKQTSRQNDKQETLIFITPRILETPLES
jgi:type IV pilus assembly protein PilQ